MQKGPETKTISTVSQNGIAVFTDGSTGTCLMSGFKPGDQVLVWNGQIFQFKVEGLKSAPSTFALVPLLVLATGPDVVTYDSERIYFMVLGDSLVQIGHPSIAGWQLIDDGKYGQNYTADGFWDPNDYEYALIPDSSGAGVPAPLSGTSAWTSNGNIARMILCNMKELPIAFGFHGMAMPGYDIGWHRDSLIEKRYDMRGNARMARYTDEGVFLVYGVYGPLPVGVEYKQPDVATGDPTYYNYMDRFQYCPDMYLYKFDGTREVYPNPYMLSHEELKGSEILAAAKYVPSESQYLQRCLFPEKITILPQTLYDPMHDKLVDFSTPSAIFNDKGTYYRVLPGWNPTDGPVPEPDFKIIHDITYDGKLDCVRIISDEHMLSQKTMELYCNDKLIESATITPQGFWRQGREADDVNVFNGRLQAVWDFRYQILASFHNANFDILIYRKTELQGISSVNLGFNTPAWDPIYNELSFDHHSQIWQRTAATVTRWYMSINGIITPIPDIECQTNENFLQEDGYFTGVSLPGDHAIGELFSWSDITGNHMARIFLTGAEDIAMFCYETFLIDFRHTLTVYPSGPVYPQYDATDHPFTPSTDAIEKPESRVCMILKPDGTFTDVSNSMPDTDTIHRINGVCLIGRS